MEFWKKVAAIKQFALNEIKTNSNAKDNDFWTDFDENTTLHLEWQENGAADWTCWAYWCDSDDVDTNQEIQIVL